MSIFSDLKADQFIFDENFDYINNRPKTITEPITAYKVHEGIEKNTRNVYGQFNKLFDKLIEDVKAQVKKDEFDESKFDESVYEAFFDEFKINSLELIQTKLENFAHGEGKQVPASGVVAKLMISPNFSAGPIPGKNYDD